MGDALCMMMVPPTASNEDMGPSARATETTASTDRSSFRRSLNLSSGAFGLRRFSRSASQEPIADTTDATTTTTSNSNNISARRSTISTVVSPRPANTLHVRIVPHIENPSRSLIFDIFDRELQAAVYIKIGRFTDRSSSPTHMSFKSKVVSRAHCEIWMEDGKLFVRDTKSSSGTFLNHIRISPPNQESRPHEVKDGDIVQLGVDYQNGVEEIYRSVKMRFEVNRTRRQRPVSFNMIAFQNIRNLTNGGDPGSFVESQIQEQTASNSSVGTCHPPPVPPLPLDAFQTKEQQHLTTSCAAANETTTDSAYSSSNEVVHGADQVEECCICLYALAPLQALFVSPCAHTYHYKCIRPLLSSYPGFQCPICRTYSDLDANTNLEAHEVAEKYNLRRQSTIIDPASTMTCITHTTSTSNTSQLRDAENDNTAQQQQHPSSSLRQVPSTSTSQQPQMHSNDDDDTTPLAILPALDGMTGNRRRSVPGRSTRDRRTVVVTESNSTSSTQPAIPTTTTNNSFMETMDHQLPWQATRPGLPNNHNELELTERPNMTTSQDHQRSVRADDNVMMIPDTQQTFPLSPTSTSPPPTTTVEHQPHRTNATYGFVEKLKMVFFEKRKSSSIPVVAPRERKRTNRPRPLSYPNFLLRRNYDDGDDNDDDEDTSSSNSSDNNNMVSDHDEILQRPDISPTSSSLSPITSTSNERQYITSTALGQTLSRQSTTHLAEIEEEEELPRYQHNNQYQAMSVEG